MRLNGKVVIITGAAGGQGSAAARLFAREGARLVLTDLPETDGEALVSSLPRRDARAEFVPADVTNEDQVGRVVDRTLERFGRLNVLYHNAGVLWQRHQEPVHQLRTDIWDRVLTINLKGSYLFAKYSVQALLDNGGGSIILVSSTAGLLGDPKAHSYSASKGGLIPLSRSIAQRYGSSGIRCNVLCPGFIDTPMVKDLVEDEGTRERIIEHTALGRLGRPEEVARVGLFLASEESSFVTGSILRVDGGLVK